MSLQQLGKFLLDRIGEHPAERRQRHAVLFAHPEVDEQRPGIHRRRTGTIGALPSDAGDAAAGRRLRVLTPLLKFRACRDARRVTGDAMEVRGGCGYIEEWPEPRLLRDAHLGSIWEGTSNVVALDVLRAARRSDAVAALADDLHGRLSAVPAPLSSALATALDRTVAFVHGARDSDDARLARQGATALYYAAAAIHMAAEGTRLAAGEGDARRLLLARLALDHRLAVRDPLAAGDGDREAAIAALLLNGGPAPIASVAPLLS